VLGGCRAGGWFYIYWASGGNEYFRKKITDETIGESLGLEDVVLGTSLHGVLRRWDHWSGFRVFRMDLQTRRR
jgi:hypothetical protein